MGEETGATVITPAMLQEEEQIEAEGIEKERQIIEKVTGVLAVSCLRALWSCAHKTAIY